MYKFICPDGFEIEIEYEEAVQLIFGFLREVKAGDEYQHSMRNKANLIANHIPATDY